MTPKTTQRVIEAAVAVPVRGTFHYRVPVEMAPETVLGRRILVPFGSRTVTAYVLGEVAPDEVSLPLEKLRPVKEPLDDGPLFGADLLALFRFAARYYHYPLGLAIAEALPSGLNIASLQTLRLTEAGQKALARGSAPKAEGMFLMRLAKADISLAKLSKEKGGTATARRLQSRGWAEVITRLGRGLTGPCTEKWLVRTGKTGTTARMGKSEKELLAVLAEEGPAPMAELRSRFPSVSSQAKSLAFKGLVTVEERPVFRDALGRALSFSSDAPILTDEQTAAAAGIEAALNKGTFSPFVLYGPTGSGKTEVYLAAAKSALSRGRDVLMLVPEISLTPALEGLLRARFDREIGVLHSGLSNGERYDQWRRINSGGANLVLGARSAIWAPLENLGLIVVDEEHDPAYKQEDKLRYQARDLALVRGRESGAAVVLGSATPSLESYYAAQTGRYNLLTLTRRVSRDGGEPPQLPRVDVVDLRLDSGRKRRSLTPMLKKYLAETVKDSRQAILFINRRGLAGLPLCLNCGHVVKCLNCSVTLSLHQNESGSGETLACHHCGFEIEPPERCPKCSSRLLRYMGAGTQRLESDAAQAAPEARVARLDADSTRVKGEATRILTALRNRELDVLVGTQMVAKGHDFPNITLVGVIDADLGLHLPDFRAGERTFQLLAQVSGRAGRGSDPGRVVVQTYSPDHYTLRLAEKHDYQGFFAAEIEQRRELGYPPFSRLVLARFQGNSEERTLATATAAAEMGRDLVEAGRYDGVDLLGPAPAPLSKVKGKYRFQVLIRCATVSPLHAFLDDWQGRLDGFVKGSGVSYLLDVDPHHMM